MLTIKDQQRAAGRRSLAPPALLTGANLQWACLILPIAATLYSAVIALGVAHGLPGSYQTVVLCEVLLLGFAVASLLASGLTSDDWPPILLLYFLVVIAVILSMVNSRPMIETLRSTFLIGIFAMIGQRMTAKTLDTAFFVVAMVVVVVLLIEIFAQGTYVWLFQPQAFFTATRGMQASEYNNSGLFNNASSFEGRFSFGFFDIPRTSSVFMEQVSNANFACVLALYISARWGALSSVKRGALLGTVALILVSTNGRFASLLVLAMALGFFVFPMLGRITLPLASMAIAGIAIAINMIYPFQPGDDLIGRITFAGKMFGEADWPFYLGARASDALRQRDSGYTYLIGSTTIFGAIALWAFVNFYPRANDAPSRRLAFGVVGYMLGQLLVSSTSLFSIKTAALLWALVGCVRMQEAIKPRRRAEA
ncbi:hypothetical protein ACFOKI_11735 [Sphingomonas qilianensis]|uniref:Uncharacterized protein n=1 Tax=Sphingomonas qilianensis TaxID=1736690 RepID=A0ABU9XP38_9SPHN